MTAVNIREAVTPPHRACTQLQIPGLLDDTVNQLILGIDESPIAMSPQDLATQLNDPFATKLLAAGIFPNTAGEVLHALEQVDGPGGALALQRFYVVGEGSQIPPSPATQVMRNMRFLVACGDGQDGPEVVVSAFHPDQGMVELVAWDAVTGGFNFYRTMTDSNAWVFAGNSRHALVEPTRGQGPFESHVNGHLLMKELKVPWVNWHSPFATVDASVLRDQGLDHHPWLSRLEPGGAYTLQDASVQPAIRRWNSVRVRAIASSEAAETPVRFLEQLVTTLAVNLISSKTSSAAAIAGTPAPVDLPETFFVDADMLREVGLPPPPRFGVDSASYRQALQALGSRLSDGAAFGRTGDTHFAFVVPERATEDVDLVRQALTAGLLSKRLVACLTMVDFPNPVFSPRRGALLSHFSAVSWGGDGAAFSEAIASAINSSPEASKAGTPESEFAELWTVGEDFADDFSGRLNAYYAAVTEKLAAPDGFEECLTLAESRRSVFRDLPIFESQLLFAQTNAPSGSRRMTDTASVEEVA